MTRSEMESSVIADLEEMLGEQLDNSPVRLTRAVNDAVDYIATETLCLWTRRIIDLKAGAEWMCAPGLLFLTSLVAKDIKDEWYPVTPRFSNEMDGQYYRWRSADAISEFEYMVVEPGGMMRVYPPLSEARAGGLTVEGYYKPAGKWLFDAYNPVEPSDDDDCPLPEYALSAAIARARVEFARLLVYRFPKITTQLAILESQALELLGEVDRVSKQSHVAAR